MQPMVTPAGRSGACSRPVAVETAVVLSVDRAIPAVCFRVSRVVCFLLSVPRRPSTRGDGNAVIPNLSHAGTPLVTSPPIARFVGQWTLRCVGALHRGSASSRLTQDTGRGTVSEIRKDSRGFASMAADKQREIASKGGRAAHLKGTAHEWTSEEARAAGRKGGQISRGGRGRLIIPTQQGRSRIRRGPAWNRVPVPLRAGRPEEGRTHLFRGASGRSSSRDTGPLRFRSPCTRAVVLTGGRRTGGHFRLYGRRS